MSPTHACSIAQALVALSLSMSLGATASIADTINCHIGPGVSAGTTENLRAFRAPYAFSLPIKPGTTRRYLPSEIVGMGVDGENNYNFVWFNDGMVSAGSSNQLDRFRKQYRYTLPVSPESGRRYQPTDIVGMGVDGENNYNFVWFKDGYVSAGTSDNLARYRAPYRYRLPENPSTGRPYRPADIIGMGIDGGNNHIFAFYEDARVSAGTSDDLGKFRKPYRVLKRPAPNVGPEDVIGIGIDGENNHVFVWFIGRDARIC